VARITLRQLLDHAAEHEYGLPAFNINNMEQGLAIMEAAEAVNSPVIIQASRGARNYANDIMLAKMIDALVDIYPHIPVCMHQDHGNGPATCATAIQYGFTSVMMDGSLMEDAKTPASYEYNVDVTRKVVQMAHSCGVSVEGELGVLGSLETGMGEAEDGHGFEGKLSHDELLTDPDQAVEFVQATGVDALAIAMGTSHGAYKFTRKPDGDVLAMNVIEEDPPPPAQHPPGDARLVQRSAGPAGHHQPVRRRDAPDLGRAGRRDPARHQARRAQDQCRHRQPHGHHRRDPQGARREAGRVRPARLSEARQGSHAQGLPGPLRRVRLGRHADKIKAAVDRPWPSATPPASWTPSFGGGRLRTAVFSEATEASQGDLGGLFRAPFRSRP
jgi:ketose-bisphosphate aldolase